MYGIGVGNGMGWKDVLRRLVGLSFSGIVAGGGLVGGRVN